MLIIKIMEARGFTKFFRSTRTRFQAIDFGCFDVVGIRPRDESGEPTTWYASSKTNGGYTHAHLDELRRFRLLFAHSHDIVELFDWRDAAWKKIKGGHGKKLLQPKTARVMTFEEKGVKTWEFQQKSA